MQPLCWVIRMLLLSALLPWSSTGQFHVRGPTEPVIVSVGEEAVLSCHLDPVMDAQNMEVRWYRKHPSGLVNHYGASQDHMAHQMPQYQGRTELLKDNITKGELTLKIHSIHPFDHGEYSCFFESSIFSSEAQFDVLVTASGVVPHIHIEPGNTEEVKLTCTSTGWYPEPEVRWRDLQGQPLAPDPETKTTKENELFRVETSITVDKSSGGAVSCLIRNPVLSEDKEVHISMADALFLMNYPWTTVFAVLLSLLVVATTVIAIYAVRVRKAKEQLEREKGNLEGEKEQLERQKEQLEEEKRNLVGENERLEVQEVFHAEQLEMYRVQLERMKEQIKTWR